jgi:homoserine dehydrogenase
VPATERIGRRHFYEPARRPARDARTVRIGMLGCGQVGQAVLARAGRRDARAGHVRVECACALVRDANRPRGAPVRLTTSAGAVLGAGIDVLVDVMGGVEPARTIVAAALDAGIPVVTAGKTLVARHGPALRALARARGVSFTYEAAVVAGVPFVGTLSRRPHAAGVDGISGILNATSHFVVTAMAAGATAAQALARAVELGYAEADAEADLGGRDAAEKLTILRQLCGEPLATVDDVFCVSVGDLDRSDVVGARLLSGTIKPVALAPFDAGRCTAWVGPAFVPAGHVFASLSGVASAVQLWRQGGEAVTFAGPGAGPDVTAATILDDVIEAAAGWREAPDFRSDRAGRRAGGRADHTWFVRISKPEAVTACELATWLGDLDVPYERLVSDRAGVYVRTAPVPWTAIERATSAVRARGAAALALPVVP